MEHRGWFYRRSEFTRFILYTGLMLLPLAVAAAFYTGDPWLPIFLGLLLLDILARMIIVFWPVTVSILVIWIAYDLLGKNNRKRKDDKAQSDTKEPAPPSG